MAAPLPLVVSAGSVEGVGEDGDADDGGDDDDDDAESASSVLEHPALAATSASAASSNTMEVIVFMLQAFNGPIALWQPQAYKHRR